jgi:hypothetical protein
MSCPIKASSAERFVNIGLTKYHKLFGIGETMRKLSQIAAFNANGVNFGNIFGACHNLGNWAKRLTLKVHIEPSNNNPDTLIGQLIAYINQIIIEELSLINAHNINIRNQQ